MKGVLLINLGTPDNCDPKSVYRYLKEFLNDPRVIDLPAIIRWPLINGLIIPRRYKNSANAYQQIWTKEGSPLLINSLQLKEKLSAELGTDYQVELGMRYGNPSIPSALLKMKSCDKILILPLFPQYSSAATGSAIEETLEWFSTQWNIPTLEIKSDFYNHPAFIQAYADVILQHTRDTKIDLFLFSYHGLPKRHVIKSGCHISCDHINACPLVSESNRFCYRAQCYETSALLAKALDLSDKQYHVSFQSRLGRTPWIKPYTDALLPELIKQGIKNIAIACPSFVADCLETLEEINIRARKQWQTLGGEKFTFVPCLNTKFSWIKGLSQIVNHPN
ncbi:MAG: ferrochelatase [Gammaproteobacteria bacterium]